jgi:FMN-dependent dehydrogenase
MLAPVGVQSIVHQQGELAAARAAASQSLPFILSTAASHSLEEVAGAMGPASRWYQLYWPKDRALAASFLGRAADAGYAAIVVTLDTWMLGWRPRDLRAAYLPFLKGEGVANYFRDPVFRAALEKPPEEDPGPAIGLWAEQFSNPSITWADLGRDTVARSSRCCSTAVYARAATCSRRWRSGPTPCASAAPTRGGLRWTGRPGSNTCCAACSQSSISRWRSAGTPPRIRWTRAR